MSSVYIIAEIGVNHNGSFDLAKKMVREAKKCGADAVKFQIFRADRVSSHISKKAEYQKKTYQDKESQLDMIKKLELQYDKFSKLRNYCNHLKIDFLCSPFDLESAKYLLKLGVKNIKIPSGEITNISLLKFIKKKNLKKIIVSSGMANLSEVETALINLGWPKNRNIILLHCHTDYPSHFKDINLRAMQTLENCFKIQVGYSDHTLGNEASISAVAMGAVLIEKHFTIDNEMIGPDHKASMNVKDFKKFIKSIRKTEKLLGSGIKLPTTTELKNRDIVRKSLIASSNLKIGTILKLKHIEIKRPGNGIQPDFLENILGMRITKSIKKGELVTWKKLKNSI